MYSFLLTIHSWTRWIVLIFGVLSIVQSIGGLQSNRSFNANDNRMALFFMVFMHIQFTIGALLYFVYSPITEVAFNDFGMAMKEKGIRFFAIEHSVMMLIAVVFATIARSKSKRQTDSRKKFKTILTFNLISLIVVFISIPWPFMSQARPLFRI